jgi:hypothetical protein
VANQFFAAFDQGLIEMTGKTSQVNMHFTSPDNAQNIKIEFFEIDSWISNGKTITENNGAKRLIGTTGGNITGKKYHETSQSVPFPFEHTKMYLTVNIDGSSINMPIPDPKTDSELDFFEVSFKITGALGGSAQTYESPSPLFVRNTPTPRAECAIIAGDGTEFPDDPTTTRYFTLAAQFWARLQDNQRTTQLSLQSIFLYLGDNDDAAVQARNGLPWGRVNIVSHGDDGWNENTATFTGTWFIKIRDGDPIDENFGKTAAELPGVQLGFNSPPRRDVDEHTELIIRGCVIGNDVALLNAIKAKFGGLPTVFAPKYSNLYGIENGVPRDRLYDTWTVSVPGNVPIPAAAQVAALLKKRYQKHPLYGSYSDSDWAAVAAITAPFAQGGGTAFRQRSIQRSGQQSADCDKDEVQNKSQADLTALMKTKLPGISDSYAWHWTVTPPKTKDGYYLLAGTGVLTMIEFLRIRSTTQNGATVLATPNHLDPTQFGRSS